MKPGIVFETDRLYVRQYTPADSDHFYRLNGDSELMQYIRQPRNREESDQFLFDNIAFYERYPLLGRWAIIKKENEILIGSLAIIPLENSEHLQVGYMLFREHWGNGYASEAVRAGVRYAFDILKLPKIIAVAETPNLLSHKVLERCGFAQTAHFMEKDKRLVLFERNNSHFVETRQLFIFPLTASQLQVYLEAGDKLERMLGLAPAGRAVARDVQQAVNEFTVPKIKKARGEEFIFYTFWLVVEKNSHTIVAELGFKGVPDYGGNVEIGYGTMPGMEGRGVMTEAVGGILEWASGRADIQMVLAETARTNAASIRVLQKNNFQQFAEREDMLWWRYVVK